MLDIYKKSGYNIYNYKRQWGQLMSFTYELNVGKYRYVYEATSYRNEKGDSRNKAVIIGKVDQNTGQRIYKDDYIDRMKKAGITIENPNDSKLFSVDDIKKSTIREYGMIYLLQELAERDGLLGALNEAFPYDSNELFTLACYLVSSGEPFQYCEDWVRNTECPPVGTLSSQRISELLGRIEQDGRDRFYQLWCACRYEREYLALDITSTSSYSELIDDVAWGHNRDGEKLPQVNICMLMGEESRLPVYQTVYDGSLNDVKTLNKTITSFGFITEGRDLLAVMDKGFYSGANISGMMDATPRVQFVVSMPLTAKLTKTLIESARDEIDDIDNVIVIGDDSLRGVSSEIEWANEKIYAHVYYSAKKASRVREELYVHVALLRDGAIAEPHKYVESAEHKKYLRFTKTKLGYSIKIRREVLDKELSYSGWVVILSNKLANASKTIGIYRDKDVVEKGFERFKNSLDMGRLRVHSEYRMQNKLFVGFIALIQMSEINCIMTKTALYRKMTMRQLVLTLSKLRVQYIKGTRVLFPLTKTQREIFEIFDVAIPK